MAANADIGILGAPFPAIPTQFEKGSTGGKGYTLFFLETVYQNDTGIVQMPTAGPLDTPCSIVDWSGGSWQKYITCVAVCEGSKPNLPPSFPVDPKNERLAFRQFRGLAPSLMNDGVNYAYKLGIVYVYYLYGPPDFNAGLPLGRQAWDAGPPQVWTRADFDSHATGVSPQPLSGETGGTRILIPCMPQIKFHPGRVCRSIILGLFEGGDGGVGERTNNPDQKQCD